MFTVKKRIEVAGAHQLSLPYGSKCKNLHGHNWIVTIWLKGEELNEDGMLLDFSFIKSFVNDIFDHKNLNEIPYFKNNKVNPTAENIARFIGRTITEKADVYCFKVEVQESEGNVAIWEA